MTLKLDLDRAVRGHINQVRLIEAILNAPAGEPETDYCEWKSTSDISDAVWQFQSARHILGFGNRDPQRASTWFEGCGYLLLGVEPGNLVGTAVADPADVEKWVATYAGLDTKSPRWSFDYVDVHGTQVLLFTIEAPRQGDTIHTLRKAWSPPTRGASFPEGQPFIRRSGRTETANSEDIQMLVARSQPPTASVSLNLDVSPRAGDEAGCIATSDAEVEAWVDAERDKLLADIGDPTTHRGLLANVVAASLDQERRTPEKFRDQVDRWATKMKLALPTQATRMGILQGLGEVVFKVTNDTDDNFEDVIVELTFAEPDIRLYLSAADVDGPRNPDRPVRWGADTVLRDVSANSLLRNISVPRPFVTRPEPEIRLDAQNRLVVELPPAEVRPRSSRDLEFIYVFAPYDRAGTETSVAWRITAARQRGDQRGTTVLPIQGPAATIPELIDADKGRE